MDTVKHFIWRKVIDAKRLSSVGSNKAENAILPAALILKCCTSTNSESFLQSHLLGFFFFHFYAPANVEQTRMYKCRSGNDHANAACVCVLFVSLVQHTSRLSLFWKRYCCFFLSSVDDFVLFSPSHKVWVSALREKRIAKRFDSSYVHSFSLLRKTSRNFEGIYELMTGTIGGVNISVSYPDSIQFVKCFVEMCILYTQKRDANTEIDFSSVLRCGHWLW